MYVSDARTPMPSLYYTKALPCLSDYTSSQFIMVSPTINEHVQDIDV